jgi:hypothetical protein
MDAEFKRAHDAFKADLTPEELDYFQSSDLDEVKKTLSRIQRDQEAKGRLVYMRRINAFVEKMTEYEEVVKIFLNTNEFLIFIWVMVRCLISFTFLFIGGWELTNTEQGPMRYMLTVWATTSLYYCGHGCRVLLESSADWLGWPLDDLKLFRCLQLPPGHIPADRGADFALGVVQRPL